MSKLELELNQLQQEVELTASELAEMSIIESDHKIAVVREE